MQYHHYCMRLNSLACRNVCQSSLGHNDRASVTRRYRNHERTDILRDKVQSVGLNHHHSTQESQFQWFDRNSIFLLYEFGWVPMFSHIRLNFVTSVLWQLSLYISSVLQLNFPEPDLSTGAWAKGNRFGYTPQHLSLGVWGMSLEVQEAELSKPFVNEVSAFHVLVARLL